jgi:hypothetical protein
MYADRGRHRLRCACPLPPLIARMFGCMALIPIPPQCKRVFNYFILTIWLFAIKNNLAINKSHNCLPKKGLRAGQNPV